MNKRSKSNIQLHWIHMATKIPQTKSTKQIETPNNHKGLFKIQTNPKQIPITKIQITKINGLNLHWIDDIPRMRFHSSSQLRCSVNVKWREFFKMRRFRHKRENKHFRKINLIIVMLYYIVKKKTPIKKAIFFWFWMLLLFPFHVSVMK